MRRPGPDEAPPLRIIVLPCRAGKGTWLPALSLPAVVLVSVLVVPLLLVLLLPVVLVETTAEAFLDPTEVRGCNALLMQVIKTGSVTGSTFDMKTLEQMGEDR